MGAAGTRFGRNIPIKQTYQKSASTIMTPSPRTVSTELLTRKQFTPAPTLNLLAAAWLQFQIRDWFSHGKSTKRNPGRCLSARVIHGMRSHDDPADDA